MGLQGLLRQLFWGHRPAPEPTLGRQLPVRRRGATRKGPLQTGQRVRLLTPIASPHAVYIPAGATGIVVGGDAKARRASVELDAPRTRITVPWSWLEDEPTPDPAPAE
jgi:hypothetical protein